MKQFRVYQLPVEHAAKFLHLDFVKKYGMMPKLEDYKVVYEGEFEPQGEYSEPDQLYMKFQGEKPEGYKGHSISMSDVVEIDGEYFYCDAIGWENVTELFPKPVLKMGEKYECIKDYVMDNDDVAYKAGKVYEMLSDILLGVDEQGCELHKMSDERAFFLYFKKVGG